MVQHLGMLRQMQRSCSISNLLVHIRAVNLWPLQPCVRNHEIGMVDEGIDPSDIAHEYLDAILHALARVWVAD